MAIQTLKSKHSGLRYKPLVMGPDKRWMRSQTWDRKLDAEREERKLLSLRDKGAKSNIFAPLPFPEAADAWLQDCQRRVSLRQYRRTESYIRNHFLPYFGDKDVKKIKPSDIAGFVEAVASKGLAVGSANSIIGSLKAMLNFHIEEDNLDRNPVKRKHRLKTGIVKEHVVWTPEEAQTFLAYTDRKYPEKKRWAYLMYKIALNTGMRFGEILALEKGDFDFDRGNIKVSKSYCSVARQIKTPKNGKSRYAPLSQGLAEEVRRYIIDNQIFGSLFTGGQGEYQSYNTFHKTYLRDVRESGVRETKFHNTRRFFVTHYMEKGGTETQLRKIVGHASQQMTDLYTAQRNDMREFADIINI